MLTGTHQEEDVNMILTLLLIVGRMAEVLCVAGISAILVVEWWRRD